MQQIQRYFRKAGKALARFFGRVKKGSPIDIAILVCAAALIIALLAILVMSLLPDAAPVDASSSAPSSSSVSASQSGSYDPDADALDKQAYDGTILPETADGGQMYIDETMFLGDSNTYRLVAYGLTTWQNNLSAVGMGIQHVTSTPCMYFKGSSSPVYVAKAVSMMQPRRIVITYGTNNTNSTADTFKNQYRSALEAIKKEWPYADIIINAVPPVAQTRTGAAAAQKAIDEFNKALADLAKEDGYRFLNSSEALKDPATGFARASYMIEDGLRIPVPGQLYYRGIELTEIVEAHRQAGTFGFEEVAYLLLMGYLPSKAELARFNEIMNRARKLPNGFTEDMIMKSPSQNIMNKLARSVLSLYSYDENPDDTSLENILLQSVKLIGAFPSIVANAYSVKRHYFEGRSLHIHYPKENLSTAENFLRMLRNHKNYTEEEAHLLDMMLMVHAEHGGGNNSAFACRVLSSSGTDTYSAIAAAVGSLKGPRHGGANKKVMEMFSHIQENVHDWKDDDGNPGYIHVFTSGRALFSDCEVNKFQGFRKLDFEYGIVPYPKYDETQDKYYSRIEGCELFGIPKINKKPEMAGVILEAMSCESMKSVIPAYYDVALKVKYTRDDDSADMLDLIVYSFVLDNADIYQWGNLDTQMRDGMTKGTDLSSIIAKNRSAFEKAIEKTVAGIAG